ncbi:hypothetical protein L484_005529 [Morus notabilis]|uniref:DUF7734 domain-containing protein n=1 Tax=Morus notabilis TaxID=981085 RepID=W9QPY7_9ROSA|nr:uncharacterized protein LOC21388993 [Morus notabilis]EXB32325.1 hypothetical protein L484_005529 [Morus notabilis]
MLIHQLGNWVTLCSLQQQQPFFINVIMRHSTTTTGALIPSRSLPICCFSTSRLGISSSKVRVRRGLCRARRRVRYEEEEEEEEEDGHNEEILMLEAYSQSSREEALLVKAEVDAQEVELLIFKGFSSSLSYGTSPDPSKSILPARAVIKTVDIVKGPFDPSNIEYLQKGLSWEKFKTSFLSNS